MGSFAKYIKFYGFQNVRFNKFLVHLWGNFTELTKLKNQNLFEKYAELNSDTLY